MMDFNISDEHAFLQAEAFETLRLVIDPELHVNIVDLGLVYDIHIQEAEKIIRVTMTLSSSYCPMGESIVTAVKNCLQKYYTAYRGEVDLVWEPVWSYDNITDEGKKQLGLET
jgi:metal-sulfur cluster biosynthetic enzyme